MRTGPIRLLLVLCLCAPAAMAQMSDETIASIIPVAGSAAGAFGSWWTTSIQLLNPHGVTASGRLVFRPSSGSEPPNEESIAYSLSPGATQTIANLGAVIGRSGLGSLDVMARRDSAAAPIVIAHIFNDSGGGTVGMTEDAIDPNDASSDCATSMIATRVLRSGVKGYLITPASPNQFRLNVGVRTLGSGATLVATVQAPDGVMRQAVTRTYPANYFVQTTAREFVGTPITGGESIAITVTTGSAIVYGSTINNITNDAAIQYVYSFAREQ